MEWGTLVGLMLGSTVISAFISSLFTRRTAKESNEIDLLDRAYKEIQRLDEQLVEKDEQLAEKQKIINDLRKEKYNETKQ